MLVMLHFHKVSNFLTNLLFICLQLQDIEACNFLVELHLARPYPYRGSDMSTWEVRITKFSSLDVFFPES